MEGFLNPILTLLLKQLKLDKRSNLCKKRNLASSVFPLPKPEIYSTQMFFCLSLSVAFLAVFCRLLRDPTTRYRENNCKNSLFETAPKSGSFETARAAVATPMLVPQILRGKNDKIAYFVQNVALPSFLLICHLISPSTSIL